MYSMAAAGRRMNAGVKVKQTTLSLITMLHAFTLGVYFVQNNVCVDFVLQIFVTITARVYFRSV